MEVEILADVVGISTDEHVSNGPTYTSEPVEVDDYLQYGAGLYQVKVVNRGEGWRCEYTGYLELDEDPLGTPIGVAAAAGVVVGAGGVVLAKGTRRRPSRDWVDELVDDHDQAERDDALRRERVTDPTVEMVHEATYSPPGPPCCLAALALPLPAMPLFGAAGGVAAAPNGRPRRVVWSKVVFKRGHPVWGGLAGLALGLGVSVLLWQYAVWLLSLWTVVAVPVAVALLAALYAWYGRRYRACWCRTARRRRRTAGRESAATAVGGPAADRVLVEPLREVEALEDELDRRRGAGGRLPHVEVGERRPQRRHVGEQLGVLRRRDVLARVHDLAAVEGVDHLGEPLGAGPRPERLEHRRADDAVEHLLLAPVVDRLELELARGARHQRFEVADARHHLVLAVAQRAARRVGDQRLVVRDREPHRHARPLVDVR